MDKIVIRGLKAYGFHGVTEEERRRRQLFMLDLDLYRDLGKAATTDALDKTVDYAAVCQTVQEVVEKSSFKLVEALAQTVIQRLFRNFEIEKVWLRIKKPDAPVAVCFDYVGVEFTREKKT